MRRRRPAADRLLAHRAAANARRRSPTKGPVSRAAGPRPAGGNSNEWGRRGAEGAASSSSRPVQRRPQPSPVVLEAYYRSFVMQGLPAARGRARARSIRQMEGSRRATGELRYELARRLRAAAHDPGCDSADHPARKSYQVPHRGQTKSEGERRPPAKEREIRERQAGRTHHESALGTCLTRLEGRVRPCDAAGPPAH